jgi:6 kDa early secretory antigenic target
MPQGDLVVNFAILRAAAEDINSTTNTMNSELDGLKQALSGIVAAWDGDAKTQYAAKQAQWDAAAFDLNNLLTSIKGAVIRSADLMEARERSNMQRFE